jgi:hypothetical protein
MGPGCEESMEGMLHGLSGDFALGQGKIPLYLLAVKCIEPDILKVIDLGVSLGCNGETE